MGHSSQKFQDKERFLNLEQTFRKNLQLKDLDLDLHLHLDLHLDLHLGWHLDLDLDLHLDLHLDRHLDLEPRLYWDHCLLDRDHPVLQAQELRVH